MLLLISSSTYRTQKNYLRTLRRSNMLMTKPNLFLNKPNKKNLSKIIITNKMAARLELACWCDLPSGVDNDMSMTYAGAATTPDQLVG